MLKTAELKKVYTKEYLILIGIGFLPLLWKILEIAFLSSFNNALKILGQIALISIIFKEFNLADIIYYIIIILTITFDSMIGINKKTN